MTRLITLTTLCLMIGSLARAHDGGHGPVVLASVQEARTIGRDVDVILKVTGLDPDHVVRIDGFLVDGAQPAALPAPVAVMFARDAILQTRLRFHDTPPGIFTLAIDFGPDGQGGVVVMPTHAPTDGKDRK
ncbi:MAG: hypothetical protein AAFN94_11390 [Pseudomonadota bacterium]